MVTNDTIMACQIIVGTGLLFYILVNIQALRSILANYRFGNLIFVITIIIAFSGLTTEIEITSILTLLFMLYVSIKIWVFKKAQ